MQFDMCFLWRGQHEKTPSLSMTTQKTTDSVDEIIDERKYTLQWLGNVAIGLMVISAVGGVVYFVSHKTRNTNK